MKKADLASNHLPFDKALQRYKKFCKKVLTAKNVIKLKTEKEDVFESVLLRTCAQWERFVDEHLVDAMNVDPSMLDDFFGVSIPAHPSRNLCEAMLFGGAYRDFKNFGDLKGFSKKLLPDTSNPFLAVSKGHINKIDELYKIRNYLAHYSGASRRALDRMYKNVYKLQRFVEPGRFLLATEGQRMWDYMKAFEGASSDMKDWY